MPLLRTLPFFITLALAVPAFAGDADDVAALLNKGHADDALQAADRALAKTPRDARLRLLRGNALAGLGRTADAIQVFSALTVDYPSLPEPYNNLASLYAQQGQLDKARAALELALQTNKAYATAHTNLTDVYSRLAAQAYEKALQRDIVERQSGQSAPPAPNTAPTRLALMADITTHATAVMPPATVAAAPVTKPPVVVASAKPLVVASAKPAESKPAEVKPATPATVPATVASKPVVAPTQPTIVAAATKP
ncbi:MAG: tetratricopeptide repeat protein, partial [Burkholderiales bacterium]|nr:tetratricopeptide repeat protein [Burkholderiales bacterium]